MSDVFQNLSDSEVERLLNEKLAEGKTEEEAFTEIYCVECNMDGEGEEE